jgi:uncharacterized integral membrane protein
MNRLFWVVIPAIWVVAIAIVSVQNATPISLRFLAFRSVELPFGVMLSFCAAGGMVLTAALLTLFGNRKSAL